MEDTNINNCEIKKPKLCIFGLIIATIIISSVFGSFFGFMSTGISKKLLVKLEKAYPKIFHGFGDNQISETTKQRIIQEDSAVIEVVEKKSPAVVSITITKDVPRFRNFFGFPDLFGESGQGETEKQQIGGGSGFLITPDGMIVTNKHVVSDTSAEYTVITSDDMEHKASVLARDPLNDIAIIKIDGSNFPVLDLGNSDSLKIGQTVIAIGNALGEFSNTVSRGIVSGLKRNLTASGGLGESETLTNIIQTDAAINPGNSGGPLLNISGEVIGLNVAMAQGAQNIGFAIPSNQIKRVVDQVKTSGKISTPYLGIRYLPINKQIQEANNLEYDYGILVSRGTTPSELAVIPGSPADKAGITENDIILEIGSKKITEKNPLASLLANYQIGDKIQIKVLRKGEIKNIELVLEERK